MHSFCRGGPPPAQRKQAVQHRGVGAPSAKSAFSAPPTPHPPPPQQSSVKRLGGGRGKHHDKLKPKRQVGGVGEGRWGGWVGGMGGG